MRDPRESPAVRRAKRTEVSVGKECYLVDGQTSIRLASRVKSAKQFRPALFQSLP